MCMARTVQFLSGLGHEVVPVAQLGLSRAEDADLLRVAHEQGRLLVTRDRDFGGLVFVEGAGPGVIYLRILPSPQNVVHAELERVLTNALRRGGTARCVLGCGAGTASDKKTEPEPG